MRSDDNGFSIFDVGLSGPEKVLRIGFSRRFLMARKSLARRRVARYQSRGNGAESRPGAGDKRLQENVRRASRLTSGCESAAGQFEFSQVDRKMTASFKFDHDAGLMFWFKWNRLSGSYCFLISARRS